MRGDEGMLFKIIGLFMCLETGHHCVCSLELALLPGAGIAGMPAKRKLLIFVVV